MTASQIAQKASLYTNDPIMRQIATNTGSGVKTGSASGSSNLTNQSVGWLNRLSNISAQNNAVAASAANDARDWNAQMTQRVMDFNASEAAKNRDWQKMMSDTAHQREVADLKAAGLNPVLSAMGGNGASVTSGSSASASAPSSQAAQTDMSTNSALVNILGSILSAQTQIENTRTNAQNNMAMAQLSAETNKLLAHISGDYSLRHAGMSAGSAYAIAQLNAENQRLLSQMQHEQKLEQAQQQQTFTRQNYQDYPQTEYGAYASVANAASRGLGFNSYSEPVGMSTSWIANLLEADLQNTIKRYSAAFRRR